MPLSSVVANVPVGSVIVLNVLRMGGAAPAPTTPAMVPGQTPAGGPLAQPVAPQPGPTKIQVQVPPGVQAGQVIQVQAGGRTVQVQQLV